MAQLLVLFLFTFLSPPSDLNVRVPRTSSSVMVDGVLSKGEWQKSARVEVPGVAELYFQCSAGYVYIAVEYTHAPSGIVDLYLSPHEGEIIDLHASAKLGERELQNGTFPDWIWWNNRDWVANVSRVDSFENRTFMPAPVREYQIRRSRFPSRVWYVRFELTAMNGNQIQSTAVFPKDTLANSTDGWLLLSLK